VDWNLIQLDWHPFVGQIGLGIQGVQKSGSGSLTIPIKCKENYTFLPKFNFLFKNQEV
jgi:hypothetical protein